MTSKLDYIYQRAFKAFQKCHALEKGDVVQRKFVELWHNQVPKHLPAATKEELGNALVTEWELKSTALRPKSILDFFKKGTPNSTRASCSTSSSSPIINTVAKPVTCQPTSTSDVAVPCKPCSSPQVGEVGEIDDDGPEQVCGRRNRPPRPLEESDEEVVDDPVGEGSVLDRSYKTPSQDRLKTEITKTTVEIQSLQLVKNAGLDDGSTDKKIRMLEEKKKGLELKLRILKQSASRMKKSRAVKKRKIQQACESNPELANILHIRGDVGRPRLEDDQPDLLKTIIDISIFGAAAQDKRQSEVLRSCRTLSDLQKELDTLGFKISRSATYLRLVPKNRLTSEGKRHVKGVPVRLGRPQADHHKAHIDQHFCTATIRGIETVASILGPDQVIFISQDDKARVPLGKTAANKQTPILMHLEYRVKLPDHDWVVAERHKLIPSVYAYIMVKRDAMGRPEAVTYSGPTFCAIRSGKHSSSSAATHAADIERLFDIPSFKTEMLLPSGAVKPVMILSVDGGPDENPRYPKVIGHGIDHFKKYDLDALWVFTNAPGRSAYNRVERRMAPLSHQLSGVILDHAHYGTHLDSRSRTVDIELEKKNFQYAGEVLAELWNELVIDGHPVTARYVEPDESLFEPQMPSESWYASHVRESQYFLQIVKCTDRTCCSQPRSALRHVLPDGFLPPPYLLMQTPAGLVAPAPGEDEGARFAPLLLRAATKSVMPRHDAFNEMPYDFFCPSVKDELFRRTCGDCGLYFVSLKKVKLHKAGLHGRNQVVTTPPIRPLRAVARRRQEVLCHLNEEVAEWVAEEDVETPGDLPIIPRTVDDDSSYDEEDLIPLIELKRWRQPAFVEDLSPD